MTEQCDALMTPDLQHGDSPRSGAQPCCCKASFGTGPQQKLLCDCSIRAIRGAAQLKGSEIQVINQAISTDDDKKSEEILQLVLHAARQRVIMMGEMLKREIDALVIKTNSAFPKEVKRDAGEVLDAASLSPDCNSPRCRSIDIK